ncbi:MAG: hypothetical protein JRN52_04165 [Nitrososphaerota archaeon]|nr:hypothetical protein [Nitrososphaerota archaeon]
MGAKTRKTGKNKCPKCGGKMVEGVCTKCKYSPKTAYKSRTEAKEFTYAAD